MTTMTARPTDGEMDPKRVKRLRERLKLTQQQMADKLGVSLRSVIRWEHGTTAPHKIFVKLMRDM